MDKGKWLVEVLGRACMLGILALAIVTGRITMNYHITLVIVLE